MSRKSFKDETERKLQADAKKGSKKLYQLDETMQLTLGRFESAISEAPLLSKFSEQVAVYMGALLNSYGGIVRWGVSRTGLARVKVVGTFCDRKMEDDYKVAVDRVAKGFSPRVDPSLYRLDFVEILRKKTTTNQTYRDIRVIELRVQAGEELLYMDQEEKVRVVNASTVYGPLIPQEIKRLVLKKYRKELLDSQSLLDVITPLTGRPPSGLAYPLTDRPPYGIATPLAERPPSGVSVDTQTSPALCQISNGTTKTTIQGTPMPAHVGRSRTVCAATPIQSHVGRNSGCSVTPMQNLETPKQNLQTALETSVSTPFIGNQSSSSTNNKGCSDDTAGAGNKGHSAETQHTDVLNTTQEPAKQGSLSTELKDTPQSQVVSQDVDAPDVKDEEVPKSESAVRPDKSEAVSQDEETCQDLAKKSEVPFPEETQQGKRTNVSSRRDSIDTFAHNLLEETLESRTDLKSDLERKENEAPTPKAKETAAAAEDKSQVSEKQVSLATKLKTFFKDVRQKIRPSKESNASKDAELCQGKASKMLKGEGNVRVKVGAKENDSESDRKRKIPGKKENSRKIPQRPASRNQPCNQPCNQTYNESINRSGNQQSYDNLQVTTSYNQRTVCNLSGNQQSYNHLQGTTSHNQQLGCNQYNQAYNQSSNQSCNQQSYNQQSYNQQSYNHLLQAATSYNQGTVYDQMYNQSCNKSCNQESNNLLQPTTSYNQRTVYNQTYNQSYNHLLQATTSYNQVANQTYDQSHMTMSGYQSSFVTGHLTTEDWIDYYRLRQQAGVRETWRQSYY